MNDGTSRRQGMTGGQKALIGCGVIALLIVILLVVGFFWLLDFGKEMMADVTYVTTSELLDDAGLDESPKQAVLSEFARLRDQVKSGEVGIGQFVFVLEQVFQGPEMALVVLAGFDKRFVESSGLSDEEKAAAPLIVQRFIRGVIEGSIPDNRAMDAWYDISQPITYGNESILERELRPSIDDEGVRHVLADLKSHADDASVPEEPYQPDLAAEVRKGIDRVVGP